MLKRSTIKLLRLPFSVFLSPIYFFALSEVPDINWTNAILVFIILHLLIYPASNGYNSYMDRDTGSIGGIEKPPPPSRQLFFVTIVLDILAIFLSLLIFISHKLLRPARKMVHGGDQPAEGEKGQNAEKAEKMQPQGEPSTKWRPKQGSPETARGNEHLQSGNNVDKGHTKEPEAPGAAPAAEPARASIMGALAAYKDIPLQGVSHRVVVIRDDKDAEYLVDLGPTERFTEIALERGMYMMIHGWVTMVGNRQGLRASQVQFNGGVINIGA